MYSVKLTLSIPDNLSKRIEPYRDRLNLSRITAAALEREVARLECRPQYPPPQVLDAIVQRLRRQKAERTSQV